MEKKLKNGIVRVVFANLINLLVSIFNGFIIPHFLTLSSYADYKTFLLYISYLGIFHLGYVDGVYIRLGGRQLNEISKEDMSDIHNTFFIFQLFITILGIIVSLIINDFYILVAALCLLPINMQILYRLVFQATGEFDKYKKILNSQVIGVFFFNLLMVAFKKNDAKIYAIGYLVISMLVAIYFCNGIRKMFSNTKMTVVRYILVLREYIALGFVIMLGNFMSIWITSIDRLFVKANCTKNDFAYYSFSVSMLKIINVVLGAFSVTLYSHFCEHNASDQVMKIRKLVLVIGSFAISVFFVIRYMIKLLLPNYIPSLDVIMYLISSQIFVVIINSIYLNLYKAFNQQKKYLKIMVKISIISIIANFVLGHLFMNSIISFAYATFITMIIWLVLCQMDFIDYRMQLNEWVYIIFSLLLFFVFSHFYSILGFVGYIGTITFLSFLFHKEEVKMLIEYTVNAFSSSERK